LERRWIGKSTLRGKRLHFAAFIYTAVAVNLPPERSNRLSIKIAIAGVGNCASSLMQGLGYYAERSSREQPDVVGLAHPDLGGYRVQDIEVVAAFDIDVRKVGQPLEQAIFALPNNTKVFYSNVRPTGVIVQMGPILDGVAPHMAGHPLHRRFEPARNIPADVVGVLRESGAEVLVNYMPVGATQASEFYAEACLLAGVGFINCVPVFIVSNHRWAERFVAAKLPCIGDDIKAQVGATITHRTLARLFTERGVRIDSTYQINTGGNTDFLNMLAQDRLGSKRESKTMAVQSELREPLDADQIHIGPSDFVPFLKDNKVCFLRIDGTGFGGVPLNLELRLSVEDSPNSAGVVVDAIRCCKLAREANLSGPILPACAWTMKHPPKQMPDREANEAMQEFVAGLVSKPRRGRGS
jgi:myo-inositol-1-phosphate synthase